MIFYKWLALLWYILVGKDLEKVPYPLVSYIIERYGGWAGVSFFLSKREREYEIRLAQVQKVVLHTLFVLVLLIAFWGAFHDLESFLGGFSQNLFADLILLIMILYLLPQRLKDEPNYAIAPFLSWHFEREDEIILGVRNTGEGFFRAAEILWEFFLPIEWVEDLDDTQCEEGEWEHLGSKNVLFPNMLRLYGTNRIPLFENGSIIIATFKANALTGSFDSETLRKKLYYRFWTAHGYFPPLAQISEDFWGAGMSLEQDPKVGELLVDIDEIL